MDIPLEASWEQPLAVLVRPRRMTSALHRSQVHLVLPMIDLRCPWQEITAVLPADSYWNAPAFSFASMVIVRTAEGSPIPTILPVSSYGALWSRLQVLEAAHRALHTPQDATGTRIIDTVGENVYYGGFSPVDDGSLSLCVVTRQEARGQFSSNL